MTQNIPSDLLPRSVQILLPLVATVAEREALLVEAFYSHPQLLSRIDRQEAPEVFSLNCLKKLLDHGYLNESEHALACLLRTTRGQVGLDKHAEIDALISLANRLGKGAMPLTVPRQLELDYLAWLKQEELLYLDRYTPISGGSQQQRRHARMRVVCSLEPFDKEQPPRPFVDAVEELHRIQRESGRAVLLGDPGGGKTTILWKLADDLVAAALDNPAAPIPLLIRLGFWNEPTQSLTEFIAEQLNATGALGNYLNTLLAQKRAALLLDGLNELPVAQRAIKYPQVRQLIEQHQKLLAVVSCRKEDYAPNHDFDLGCDRINILPLDAMRIRQFSDRYLLDQGEAFFWDLAGERTHSYYDDFIVKVGAQHEERFWLDGQPPQDLKWTYDWDSENKYSRWTEWINHRETPASLMVLARNPYMLWMLIRVYAEHGVLPANRGDLFRKFVEKLLAREEIPVAEWPPLIVGLAQVAYAMQSQRASANGEQKANEAKEGNALTVLPVADVRNILDEDSLKLAGSASILNLGEQVRFTHQLLQEYFAARYLQSQLGAGQSDPSVFWPMDRWWQRTNWEEVAILLAGLYPKDCSSVVEWIAPANPYVAAQCATRSGADPLPAATRDRLRKQWIPRLTDLKRDAQPEACAAVGRALGLLNLDNRRGVGVVDRLPDIDWVEIPAREFRYGIKDESEYVSKPQSLTLPTFYISRYPVTYAQFQTFLDDPEGFNDQRWFDGLAANDDQRQMLEQSFKFANHPRETVNWYQAMAFCRWLSWRVGGGYDLKKIGEWAVRLPTEFEWEKAARGTDGRIYPYGNDYDAEKGNTNDTGIGQTNAVGIFPNGASPYGVEEMSGNVWEWCLSNYFKPEPDAGKETLNMADIRVLRGGAWNYFQDRARAVYRNYYYPGFRGSNFGFRVVSVYRPPSSS